MVSGVAGATSGYTLHDKVNDYQTPPFVQEDSYRCLSRRGQAPGLARDAGST